MRVGYIRVSSEEQSLARQKTIMDEYGVEEIFQDVMSGKSIGREGFQKMMAFVRKGDVLIVESFSRLARNTMDLLKIVDELATKNVQLISKKENIDTDSPSGRLMLTLFAAIAQFERDIMLERQREGIIEAKKAGKYKGGKPKINMKEFLKYYNEWKSGEIKAVRAMKLLNISANTFYRKVREIEGRKTDADLRTGT